MRKYTDKEVRDAMEIFKKFGVLVIPLSVLRKYKTSRTGNAVTNMIKYIESKHIQADPVKYERHLKQCREWHKRQRSK